MTRHLFELAVLASLALVVTAIAPGGDRPKADAEFAREGKPERREKLDPMEWKAPPKLEVETWVQGEPTTFERLRGKVVLIDFWGTW